jgi:flagellar basal-body rod protein FlgC
MGIASIAATGLQAAERRLLASANNVANAETTAARGVGGTLVNEPYRAQRVEQVSLASGGVAARVVKDANPTVRAFDPASPVADENGFVEKPNVSLDNEIIQQNIAGYDFKANLKVIKAQDENFKSLLDIQA